MPISIEADPTLAQGYIKVNGTTAATVTTGGISGIANGAVTPAKLSQPLTLATAQATTSGTSIDFTGIPSWAKRITVMLNGVSTNGSSLKLVRLGTSGGIVTSAYDATGGGFNYSSATSGAASTAGFPINSGGAGDVLFGIITICNIISNSWVCSGTVKVVDSYITFVAGGVALSGTLDRVRLTTFNGTDTFDAGTVNIMYEG